MALPIASPPAGVMTAVPRAAEPHPSEPLVVDRLEAAEIVGADRPGEEVLVFTIHDGNQVPAFLFGEHTREVLARPDVSRAYVSERDWGANLVARAIARVVTREVDAESFTR